MKKSFVPRYNVLICFYDLDDIVFRSIEFQVDYFLKDENGVNMYDRIQDEWCIPYDRTSIHFFRIPL